jgi:hypothetical protein
MALTGKGLSQSELINWMDKMDTLIDELRTDINTIATFQAALTAKLDADAGITDTDYASSLTEVAAVTAAAVGVDIDSAGTKSP